MRWPAIVYCLALILTVAGCHKLLGDYTLEPGCAKGSKRCVGNLLQSCNSQSADWENLRFCPSEPLCSEEAGDCLLAVCATGERRCSGAVLELCSATRDGWITLQTCASAGRCSGELGSCTDEPCTPGMLQCNGKLLQSCLDNGLDWHTDGECETAALCNKTSHQCEGASCQLGELRCSGAELQTCNDTLSGWTTLRKCESAALCDKVNGTCGEVTCTVPGEFTCQDDTLQQCKDDLTGWTEGVTCQTPGHCDAIKGICAAEPCQPGTRQCHGATLVSCKADRSGWDSVATCQSDALCQQTISTGSAGCVPPVCEVGAPRCSGVQPEVCNAGRSGYRPNGAPCATPELCNATTATCDTPVCTPGARTCRGAQPHVCNAGLTMYVPDGPACASEALCNLSTGTCGDQKCAPGQLRCDPMAPTRLQRCKDDLTDWEPVPCDTCATAELCTASLGALTCDANSCKEPVCDAGVPHCGGTGADQGKALEVCNAGRTGYTSCQTCETAGLCEVSRKTTPFACTSKACTAPTCALTDRWCGGTGSTQLYQCPPSRINSEATLLDTCVTAGLCELTHSRNKTKCEAPTCNVNDRWCSGTGTKSLYQCPASRINTDATVIDVCATQALCEQTRQANKTKCDSPKCDVGETRCGGTDSLALQMCNSDRTGFNTCATCATAELCTDSLGATTCSASACLLCAVDEAHCNEGGDYEVCAANQKGFDTVDCMGNGCDETMGGCLPPPDTGGTGGTGGTAGMGGTGGTDAVGGTEP